MARMIGKPLYDEKKSKNIMLISLNLYHNVVSVAVSHLSLLIDGCSSGADQPEIPDGTDTIGIFNPRMWTQLAV
jgi:hypothetical protein